MTIRPDEWLVERRKIVDYLLDISHTEGHAKAKALLNAGFRRSEPQELTSALLDHVRDVPRRDLAGHHGTYLVFEGPLVAPKMTIARFRSVWLMPAGARIARLVTAYPFDERKAVVIDTFESR